MRLRWIVYVAIAVVVLAGAGFAAFKLSPWPSVLLVRYAFDKDSIARNQALEKHLPANVTGLLDQSYGEASTNKLDVFFPTDAETSGKALPTVMWIHGGAFIAGQKADVAPYLKILAGRAYTVIGVGYSIAPGAQYPTPVVEANQAITYVLANAGRLHVDPARLFLAGDSAGAQIAAQLAAAISDSHTVALA